jgi:hypothetical protein
MKMTSIQNFTSSGVSEADWHVLGEAFCECLMPVASWDWGLGQKQGMTSRYLEAGILQLFLTIELF